MIGAADTGKSAAVPGGETAGVAFPEIGPSLCRGWILFRILFWILCRINGGQSPGFSLKLLPLF